MRRRVPGLIGPEQKDGVYPGEENREIEFLLEAKMMGGLRSTPTAPARRRWASRLGRHEQAGEGARLRIDRPQGRGRRGDSPWSACRRHAGGAGVVILRVARASRPSHLLLPGGPGPRWHVTSPPSSDGPDRGPGRRRRGALLLRADQRIAHYVSKSHWSPHRVRARTSPVPGLRLQGLRSSPPPPRFQLTWSRAQQLPTAWPEAGSDDS